MAKTTNGGSTWTQPTIYHGVSPTNRGRGYYIRVPHMPILDTIAREHGAEAAELWHGFMVRALTQIGGARGSAKDVAQTRDAESAAIAKAFEEVANSTYKSRGDDMDVSEAGSRWNKALREYPGVEDALKGALEKAGVAVNASTLDAAFKKLYPAIVDKFGEAVAAAGYTPTKKGSGKAQVDDALGGASLAL